MHAVPRDGWICFHCGDVFRSWGAARDHFGFDSSADPACRIKAGLEGGLVAALRRAEEDAANAWTALHQEGFDVIQRYRDMAYRHAEQLRAAEEEGYSRGLRDARLDATGAAGGEDERARA